MSDSEKEDETPIKFAPPSDNESDDDGPSARPQPSALGALSTLVKNPLLPTPPDPLKTETVPPVIPATAPKHETAPAAVSAAVPNHETIPPVVQAPAPKLDTVPPVVQATAPKVETVPPAVSVAVPQHETIPPAVQATAPKHEPAPTTVSAAVSQHETVPPVGQEAAPKHEPAPTAVHATTPKHETVPITATTAAPTHSNHTLDHDGKAAPTTNESHPPSPPTPSGSGRNSPVATKLDDAAARGSRANSDVHEEIQKAMAGVINDLKQPPAMPTNNTSHSRLSNTSTHSATDKANASSPAPIDQAVKGPRSSTSMADSALRPGSASRSSGIPMAPSPMQNRQDESSSDDGIYGIKAAPTKTKETMDDLIHPQQPKSAIHSPVDDAFFDTKVATDADEHQPASAGKANILDETTRFISTSPKSPGSRAPSVTSKRSTHATPDEQLTSGDEKQTHVSPVKAAHDAAPHTDRVSQEVAAVARRPSGAASPFDRPRSPTPDDSVRALVKTGASPVPVHAESQPTAEHQPHDSKPKEGSRRNSATDSHAKAPSPALSDHHRPGEEKQHAVQQPPQSRRESTNKGDQQQTSRPSSAVKPKVDDSALHHPGSAQANEFPASENRSKLIKTEQAVQLPKNNMDEQRPAGSRPTSAQGESTAQAHPAADQNRSRPPSAEIGRTGAVSPISNEKVIDGDILPSHSRRESNIDRKSPSPGTSDLQAQGHSESQHEPTVPSRRTSNIVPESTSQPRQSKVNLEIPNVNESNATSSKTHSRQPSNASAQQVPIQKPGPTPEPLAVDHSKVAGDQPKVPSRRGSTAEDAHVPSKRESTVAEQPIGSRKASVVDQPKVPSRRGSAIEDAHVPSKRESTVVEQPIGSRKPSVADEAHLASKRESTVVEQPVASRKPSVANEPKAHSRSSSIHDDAQALAKGASPLLQQPVHSRSESFAEEPKVPSKRPSAVADHHEKSHDQPKIPSRQSSAKDEAKPSSKRGSTTQAPASGNGRASDSEETKVSSRRSTVADEPHVSSKRGSTADEHYRSSHEDDLAHQKPSLSRKGSTAPEHHATHKEEMLALEQHPGGSSRRESHLSEKPKADHRKSSSDELDQKSPSKPVSRKESFAEQPTAASRRESHLSKPATGSLDTENRDHRGSSPRRSFVANAPRSGQSSRRDSETKSSDEAPKVSSHRVSGSTKDEPRQPVSTPVKSDSRRSSFNMMNKNGREINLTSDSDAPASTPSKTKEDHGASDGKRRTSAKQPVGQQLKKIADTAVDETTLLPFPKRSGKSPTQNAPYFSGTESDRDNGKHSKLPQVSAAPPQEVKGRRVEVPVKQAMPLSSHRSDYKALSSSHATTPSEEDRNEHWIRQVPIPMIHLTDDDEASTPREDHPRPQSPNVGQIAVRNPTLVSPINTSTAKTRSPGADGKKRKEPHRPSRRSNSADSATNIRLVDDHSLDSASENNVDFDRHKRRHNRMKGIDIATNTEQIYETEHPYGEQNTTYQLQPRSYFDEQEYTPQKPMRATKPMADHLHGSRRRTGNKELELTTPETTRETVTPVVRRSVKHSKDANQEKDPVNVNVTVVVKKFASASNDRPARVSAEAYVEDRSTPPSKHQKEQPHHEPVQQPASALEQQHDQPQPEPYFEPVQHPPLVAEQSQVEESEEKPEEPPARPKSTEQPTVAPPKPAIQHEDRHTQSDTEQFVTEQQKKRRRPKRISRTCQTYECVFRRMEREQTQDLRNTSETEKNVQTRKSQLRPRKKSSSKNHTLYLSTDSFRMEDFLPNQLHQSRRNMSKSSAIARSLSPQGGKLLILRPTLPFHHSDAVNVQRVCLQYAIDLIPSESTSNGSLPGQRNKLTVINQPEPSNALPAIRPASPVTNTASNRSQAKEKSAAHKHDEQPHQRKKTGTH